MRRLAFTIPLLLGLLAAACASGSDQTSLSSGATATTAAPSVATSAVSPSTTTTTAATSADGGTATTQAGDAPQPALEISVYWTRPYGRPDAIDTAVYHDTGDARPYVLYGSVTNTGGVAIASPWVDAVWPAGSFRAQVVDPSGAPLASLAPGATADLLLVVDDPAVAPQLADASPTLEGMGRA